MLPLEDRRALLVLARAAVHAAVAGGPAPDPGPLSAPLSAPGAAFVTLKRDGELRGCIGHLRPDQPLAHSVARMAAAAATEDGRFGPVTPEEAPLLDIEISVLTPMRRISGPSDVVVGRDGLFVRSGPLSGLLLPQVAVEHGWDAETFLSHTCRKAGLPADTWRTDGLQLFAFEAEKF